MSHEWNCTCVRCERERDWLDNEDSPPDSPPDDAASETQAESPSGYLHPAIVVPGASYAD